MTTQPLEEHPGAIAVVGMAARFPGARNTTEFWRNLCEGVESIQRHSREEALRHGMTPEQVDSPEYVNASGALEDVECFDGAFFGYSARESAMMDPQHRIFLECAYHAMEDAGYDGRRCDVPVGVYGGCTMDTYLVHNVLGSGGDALRAVGDMAAMLGHDKDFLTTRVSYKLDLRGPSIGVQTSCSSSLVAVHLACRALLDEECDLALAGGSSVRLPHGAGYLSTPSDTSAPDGHCRAFDADAAGPVVGNGVGVVVLKRLADAIRDGDQVHAVIRGSAVGNDGQAKSSYTAPSVSGQATVIERALARAAVSARDIDVVEAHGTATPIGDPIEVAALSRAFRQGTDETGYCLLGSVKPNIGHLDAAAGAAGLVKAILMVKHRRVPPVLHFRRANPRLELDSTPFRIPMDLTELSADRPVRASVNSVGMGGTNAHLVVEEAPARPRPEASRRSRHPVLLSARSATALDELSRSIGQHLREDHRADPADVAHTLATGRPEWEFRRVLSASSRAEIADGLLTKGSRRVRDGHADPAIRAAFLLAGQGAQRLGMGLSLAAAEPLVKAHLDTVFALFARHGVDLASALDPAAATAADKRARLAETDLTQPALFAVEWAVGRALLDCGVRPYALLGHSIGELVGATLANVFSLESAVEIVAARGRLLAATAPAAMAFAPLSEAEARAAIEGRELALAAVNGERLVTVAGTEAEVDRFLQEVPGGRLAVTRAFHSPLVAPAADEFVEVVSRHKLCPPEIPVVSNLTGDYLTDEQATSPEYWGQQMCATVRFADGLDRLSRDGVTCWFELSPDNSLDAMLGSGGQMGGEDRGRAARDLRIPILTGPNGGDAADLLDALTSYWLAGGEVAWAQLWHGERRMRVGLPLYPFERTRHWLDPGRPSPAPATSPQPIRPVTGSPDPGRTVAGPTTSDRTPMQAYLTALWLELLGGQEIGLQDDFFQAGGHSLLAMQMVTALQRDGAEGLAMTTVFELPTIAQLAAHLEAQGMRPPEPASAVFPPGPAAAATAPPVPAAVPGEPDDPVARLVASLAAMSEDEVEDRLARIREVGA
ncbi:Acyl transferase domain-containing protein [Micromonospora pallida]|uniref:Acyl transferase domain-containing protein n=1 Tax=Micromonospora pallida TaxID=145854 RepID=A0A1C6SD20_9ACTN|nr:type I polyketide synthase [Micromonospora pallida]SCL27372.1 Acyl transferase domain-containing protein [Micromonospora pallida]